MSEAQNARSEAAPTSPTQLGPSRSWLEAHSDVAASAIVLIGMAVRIRAAQGTFLNPDEALHYFIANRASWSQMYQASLTMAHPPLLFGLLYLWRHIGSSEFVLRLPSVLAGTAFCWIFFKWMKQVFGLAPAWIALILVTLLPSLVALSTEIRQYEWLLLFAASAAYLLEKALAQNSALCVLFSSLCLYGAMLSHYSAFLFAATMGLYGLWRVLGRMASPGLRATWIAGQMGAIGLGIALYVTHIVHIRNTTMAEAALDTWLYKSYLHPGQNPLLFMVARSFSVFQYLFGQRLIGDLAALAFLVGVFLLLRRKVLLPYSGPTRPQSAVLLVLPFVLNCAAALADAYPYGGTRHCVFLVIFAIAGVSLFLAKVTQQRVLRGVAVAIVITLLCLVFPSRHQPYIARADQTLTHMQDAMAFVRQQVSTSDTIFVDYETGILFAYYMCERQPVSYDASPPGFLLFRCGGHRIISTSHDLWFFTPQKFLGQWDALLRSGQFRAGDGVWVGQAGFNVTLDEELRGEFPEFHNLQTQTFGHNIRLFRITVGQPMPQAATMQRSGVQGIAGGPIPLLYPRHGSYRYSDPVRRAI